MTNRDGKNGINFDKRQRLLTKKETRYEPILYQQNISGNLYEILTKKGILKVTNKRLRGIGVPKGLLKFSVLTMTLSVKSGHGLHLTW